MEYYNLDRLVDLIRERNFKLITIQCSDTNESIRLCDYLQNVFPKESERNFYILGDVLTGSCCLDIIATKRLNADCIVYIGESCFFDLEIKYHVFHLYPKLSVDLSQVEEKVNELCNLLDFQTVLYVYKCTFQHVLEEVVGFFLKNNRNVLVASCSESESLEEGENELVTFSNRKVYHYYLEDGRVCRKGYKRRQQLEDVSNEEKEKENKNELNSNEDNKSKEKKEKRSNRNRREKKFSDLENVDMVFYLNDNDDETLSKSISLESRCEKFYELRVLEDGCTLVDRGKWSQQVLMKRYLAVEKAKEAQVFGIITLTKSFKNGNRLRRLLKELLMKKKRKCSLFCINHLTEAKLQNFPVVEAWVLLSCNLTHLSLERELGRLVVFPYELLVALDVLDWSMDSYVYDFLRLSEVTEEYIGVNYPENEDENAVEDEFRENKDGKDEESREQYEHEELRTVTKMELSRRFQDLYETISCNEKRGFRGLDPEYNFDRTPRILKGSSGTPASYKHELEYK